jgi:PilZ domain-containing protein
VNRGPSRSRPARRRGLIGWLLGSPDQAPAAAQPEPAQPEASVETDDQDLERAALLGGLPTETPPVEDDTPRIPRDMFRVNVNLPANMEIAEEKEVPVRITNISGTGAALLYDSADPLPSSGNWLDLALPNRPKPFELELEIVRSRPHLGPQGQDQQIAHARFPSIRRNEQDAIIAYINNIRLYESKQYTVAAKVMLEVVTGRRRFAKFTGETIEIRPDMMRLLMDDFDAIAGAEVMLTVMAPKFADHIDVEDVKVEKVEIISARKAEVEVSLATPDDKVLLFIRKHYPGVTKGRR